MAEVPQRRREGEEDEKNRLFVLASELEPGVEGRRRRLEEKEKLLLSAGVVFPGEGEWEDEGAAMVMMAGGFEPDGYDAMPVSPGGATSGSRQRWGQS